MAKAVLAEESKTGPGTRVFKAEATDADSNAVLEYQWTPGLGASSTDRFYISPTSGVITTVGKALFPENHVYRLSIRVVDLNAVKPETSFADMLLWVYTSYQPVVFPAPIFQFNYSEELPPETIVGYVPARSLNSLDENITFTVLRGPDPSKEPIRINNGGDGRITTKRHYDYELILDHSWSYLIEAHVPSGFSATALMVVNIIDTDDNPPFFELVEYQSAPILETVQIGSVVLEVTPGDRDTLPANRVYQYRLQGAEAVNFRVVATSKGSAQIETFAPLSFAALPIGRPFYEFELIASDASSSASTLIRVMVQNANVNPPVIIPLPRLKIFRQQIAKAYPFAQVAATDEDGGNVSFFFVDTVTNRPLIEMGPFRIETNTGKILLIREPQLMNYTLPVGAADDGTCPGCPQPGTSLESKTMEINVEVVDKNLVAPQFTQCPATMTLEELAPAETIIGSVAATDTDNPDLAAIRLRYELIGNTVFARPHLYLQIVQNNGSIYNVKPLLRTADQFGGVLPDQLYFTVAVYDWGVPELKSLCNFRLEIVDINNYPPQFDPTSYTAFVQRFYDFSQYPLSPILQVVAVDLDQPDTLNAQILYEFASLDLTFFAINQSTGEISVTTTLTDPSYTFEVQARNPIPLAKTWRTWQVATVTVVTSNAPQLLPPVIKTEFVASKFLENSTNLALAQIVATPWPGATYDYSIAYIPGAFEQTGWINSPPPFTSEIVYSSERRPTLTIYSGSNFLYQRINRYIVRVRACQQPTHPVLGDICADVVMTFQLEDVNNMVPQFIDQFSLSEVGLPENAPSRTVVLKLFAVDLDPTTQFNKVQYSLMQTTDDNNFVIEGDLLLTVAAQMDFERKKNYVLKVKAEDSASSSLQANEGRPNSAELPLTVYLLDQNDRCPQFISTTMEFSVLESAVVGSEVGKISAEDADETSVLVYTMVGSSVDFAINSATGQVLVVRPLGLATVQTQKYTVSVNDGDCEVSGEVVIKIISTNQRLPEFTQSVYVYDVVELSKVVLNASPSATDPNEPKNLNYSIGGFFVSYFSINSTTGALSIVKGMPRDQPVGLPVFTISVMAKNRKGYAYAEVRVQLGDINNQYPRWPFPNSMVACPENSAVGSQCANLVAPDADFGINATSNYRAVTNNQNFRITETGSLIPLISFDYETLTSQVHYIPIVATNVEPPASGGQLFTVSGTLTVVVSDVNDSPPTIVGGPDFDITVTERANVGVEVFEIFIEDGDVSDWGKHSCVLSTQNSYFDVVYNPTIDACGIRPLQKFNVDSQPSVPPEPQNLTIIIFDSNHIHKTISNVRITVTEDNDNPPLIRIQPTSGPGELLDGTLGLVTLVNLQISIIDMMAEGAWFRLDSKSSANGAFGMDAINDQSARIQLISRLERDNLLNLLKNPTTSPVRLPILPSSEDGRVRWPLIVSVNDRREPSLTSTVTMTLTVITKGPVLPSQALEGYQVADNSPPNTPILPLQIAAMDLDYPNQGSKISYELGSQSAQALRLFTIINQTGGKFNLGLRTTLSREVEGMSYFPVPIVATLSHLARTATSTLTVTVTTDKPPAPSNALGSLEAFIPSDVWYWPYTNALPDLPIASMPVTERFDSDRINRIFHFMPENENDLMFKITEDGLLYLLTASPPGKFSVKADVETKFDSSLSNASSELGVKINWLPGSAFTNGILIRVEKATLSWFVDQVNISVSTPRDRLVKALAEKLEMNVESIAVFPANSVGDALNVFVGIHASPYAIPGRIVDTIVNDADLYTAALRDNNNTLQVGLATTVNGMSGSVDLQCATEAVAVSVCNCRGCRSRLKTPHIPTEADASAGLTSSASGVSAIGPILETSIDCWCNGGDPQPPAQEPISCLSPDACLNGGFCSVEPGTQTTICECPAGFTGPRCEQTQIYFSQSGYAWAPNIGSCTRLHVHFTFKTPSTNERAGLLMYAGPISQSVANLKTHDFIGLQIEPGGRQLKLAYSLGIAGLLTSTFTANRRLDDDNWHLIDLILLQKVTNTEVVLMVDACSFSEGTNQENGLENPPNLGDCLFSLPHNIGVNQALNVGQWPLQLGGRKLISNVNLYPTELTTNPLPLGSAFKHVLVNGELWNLVQFDPIQSTLPGPSVCLNTEGQDVCAPNGVCWESNGQAQCNCKAGFQEKNGQCTPSVFSVELGPQPSYLELTSNWEWPNRVQTEVSFDFRTRSSDGTLVYLSGPEPNFYLNSSMDIRLSKTRLEVTINLGNFDILTVSPARSQLNDGAWHHVHLQRSLSSILVEVDEGAGRGLSAFLPLDPTSTFLKFSIGKKILIGARRDFQPNSPTLADNEVRPAASSIGNACFRDLRLNNAWYPLTQAEINAAGTEGYVTSLKSSGSNRDACSDLTPCPSDAQCPGQLSCVPTWKPPSGYMCLCNPGCIEEPGNKCYCLAICSRFPCQNGGTCRPSARDSRGFVCICPSTHFGLFCEEEVMLSGLTVGGFVGIVLAILSFVGLIIGVAIWRYHRKHAPPQISPDKDLREHVMPYAEQADEIDTHSFDERMFNMATSPKPTVPPIPAILIDLLDSSLSARTRSNVGTEGRTAATPTTAVPTTSTDISSFGKVLRAQLKEKTTDVSDYTLDYGYEGASDEEGFTAEAASSLVHPETSSGFNGSGEPFGDTFDALYQLSDREHFSRDN
uniref:Neural cadherin n=1 Tax=Echinococcus granulosus TaxID=6210 RepID=A0A068WFC2_ECHGR|nr:neural cadherin [Echinococcus granulosus]